MLPPPQLHGLKDVPTNVRELLRGEAAGGGKRGGASSSILKKSKPPEPTKAEAAKAAAYLGRGSKAPDPLSYS